MSKENTNTKYGFTIIEVVLVLAIAGLIFLMVFVALPALQRSQRDTARRNDMSRVDTALVQWQTNHSTDANNLPTVSGTGTNVQSKYTAKDDFKGTNACGSNDLACVFVRDYMNTGASESDKVNEFQDPDGKPYNLVITQNWSLINGNNPVYGEYSTNNKLVTGEVTNSVTIGGDSPFSEHVVYIIPGARCSGSSALKSEKRHFAVLYRLEGAGVYCIDDQ